MTSILSLHNLVFVLKERRKRIFTMKKFLLAAFVATLFALLV